MCRAQNTGRAGREQPERRAELCRIAPAAAGTRQHARTRRFSRQTFTGVEVILILLFQSGATPCRGLHSEVLAQINGFQDFRELAPPRRAACYCSPAVGPHRPHPSRLLRLAARGLLCCLRLPRRPADRSHAACAQGRAAHASLQSTPHRTPFAERHPPRPSPRLGLRCRC